MNIATLELVCKPKTKRTVKSLGKHGFAPSIIDTPKGPMTRKEAAKAFNISINCLHGRIHRGEPMEILFRPQVTRTRRESRKPKPKGFATAYGRLTLEELAPKIGLAPATLQNRLYHYGWPHELAFNTPVFGVPGHHFILPPDEYRKRCCRVLASEGMRHRSTVD